VLVCDVVVKAEAASSFKLVGLVEGGGNFTSVFSTEQIVQDLLMSLASLFFLFLSSANVSIMIPKMMFMKIMLMMMKQVTS
jgi:hypothetical protein